MMMPFDQARLQIISGAGAKGPACFVVETSGPRLMLDLGYGPQPGLWPDVDGVGHIDALLLSHGHADHAGGLRLRPKVGNPPVWATAIVARGLPPGVPAHVLPLNGTADVLGVRVRSGRSGHAPGGIWLHLDVGGGLLYMGDNSSESALYAADPPPPATTVIVDASYGHYDTPLEECQARIAHCIDRGPLLLPVPENGRGPEIALYLDQAGLGPPHLGEVMRNALERLATTDSECLRPGVANRLAMLAAQAPAIGGARGVMLANRADGASGEAAELLAHWGASAEPAIVFTGYLPPGTPAAELTGSGRAQHLRWNVHPRLSDNAALVRATGAATVVPAFGDAKCLPDWQRAFAPARVMLQGPVRL
ncbi:MAG: MBL fold metallo-hydrolase [Betaproteobacteria bacterium]|nr:MBL fold metallo-hydrolase [Betaproteobacteria bacterium]